MAKKRYIDTKFWTDNWIQTLDPIERYFFIYLLTNEHTDICGIYEVPLKIIAVETGLEMEMVDKLLKRFRKDKKVYYTEGWIFVKNFIKHQILNESVEAGIKRSLSQIPANITNYILTLFPECSQTGNSGGGVCDILYLTLLNLTLPNLTLEAGNLNDLIEKFKEVNPSYERLYANKTERSALERLIKKFGREKVEAMIKELPNIINQPYAPKIITPYQLEKDLGKITAFVNQEKNKLKSKPFLQL